MASKYAEVVKGLSALPPEDPSYQEKIDKLKESLRGEIGPEAEALAHEYEIARTAKEDLEDQMKIIQMRLTAVEQLLIESEDREDVGWGLYGAAPNAIRLPNGASIRIDFEPTGKVEDKERFRLWCIANGYENSLQLWPTTMVALTKERLLNGEAAPDGVKAFVRPKIVWRKGS